MSYFAKITDNVGNTICNRYKITSNGLDETFIYFDTTPNGYYFIWDTYIQFYNNTGNPITGVIVLPFQRILATKYLLSNKILLIHGNNIDKLYKASTYQYSTGDISENFTLVDDTTLNSKGRFDIAENSDGKIIITWTDRRNDYYSEGWGSSIYSVYDVYGQRLDSSLNLIGSNFKINHETDELEQHWPVVQFVDDVFISIYLQHDYNTLDSISRWYIAGSSQDFYSPTPGRVYAWKYLFDFDPIVENPYPNPLTFNAQKYATIKFEIDSTSNVNYDIYNIYGQRIKRSKNKTYTKGSSFLTWNGLTDSGKIVPSGIYIWVVNIDNQHHARKITLLK